MTETDTTLLTGEDVSVGDTAPELVIEDIERVDFVKYAGASGDFNPLHVDETYATEAGYPTVFGHGMFTAGLASRLVVDWFGLDSIDRFRVRFTDQVWPGDTLTVTGEIVECESAGEQVHVECEFAVENQDSDVVLTGDSTVTLPAE